MIMSPFNKELANIDRGDLDLLIKGEISEDESLEFKKTLASNKGNDPWIDGQDKVGKKALSSLIKEIVALTNTTGGYLVLGIEETGKIRPKASKINPIPRVKALSEKLKLQIRDYVEPTINNIRFKEIETEEESGVLIIRVEKSNLAPHRSLIDKECYFRRNDRSEKMTMREIKDLTILRIRSQQDIDNEFKYREELFHKNFKSGILPYRYHGELNDERIGVRFTFIPISERLLVDRLYDKVAAEDFNKTLALKLADRREEMTFPFHPQRKQPILRGVRFYGDIYNLEALENGLIESTTIINETTHNEPVLFIHWYLGSFYRALCMAINLRQISNLYNAEFAIEPEIVSQTSNFKVQLFPSGFNSKKIIEEPRIKLPRYSFADFSEIDALLYLMIRDFYHITGTHYQSNVSVIK